MTNALRPAERRAIAAYVDLLLTPLSLVFVLLLMIYGLGVAGFITAILAAFLVGRREQLAALHGSSALSPANRVPRPRAPAGRHRGNGNA